MRAKKFWHLSLYITNSTLEYFEATISPLEAHVELTEVVHDQRLAPKLDLARRAIEAVFGQEMGALQMALHVLSEFVHPVTQKTFKPRPVVLRVAVGTHLHDRGRLEVADAAVHSRLVAGLDVQVEGRLIREDPFAHFAFKLVRFWTYFLVKTIFIRCTVYDSAEAASPPFYLVHVNVPDVVAPALPGPECN